MNKRFNMDEWYVWEQNASPMLLIMTLNPSMNNLREFFGSPLFNTLVIFEQDKSESYQGKWLFRPDEGRLLGQKMIDMLLCPPYRITYSTNVEHAEKKLLEKAKYIEFENEVEKLSLDEIIKIFEELTTLYYEYYKYAAFVEPVQWHGEFILNQYISRLFKKDDTTFENKKLNLNELLRVLFTVEEDSFTVEILRHTIECTDLLKEFLQNNNNTYSEIKAILSDKNFAKIASDIVIRADNNDALINKLKEHSGKYYWKKNNYYSTQFLTYKDILIEIFENDLFDLDNPSKNYKENLQNGIDNKKRQLDIKRKIFYNLPQYYNSVLEITSAIGGIMSDRRKKIVMTSNSAFDKLFKIIGQYTNTDINDIKLLIPQELKYFVKSPKEYKERFKERREKFLVLQTDFALVDELFNEGGTAYLEEDWKIPKMYDPFIVEGEQVEKVLHSLDKRLNLFLNTNASRKKLQGVTAFYNTEQKIIIGKVRIVKDPRSEKLNPGEILVAPSTTPDYIDAINKCSAIITDWGGLTSHAAIISRELKKPCLINTNYASDILKEGEEIKIDFLTGSIWGGQNSHAAIISRELSKPCIVGTNYASHLLETGDEIRLNLETGEIEIISKEGDVKNDDK